MESEGGVAPLRERVTNKGEVSQNLEMVKRMSKFKKVVATLASVLIFSIVGTGQAQADQIINVDLNNFQPDTNVGADGIAIPNYFVYGENDNSVVTVNVSNSSLGFLGYVNNGAGNSINIQNAGSLNVTNNTGQFYGAGDLSSLAYQTAISGSYTATITFGANALLNRNIATEDQVAIGHGASPDNALGWLLLNWSGEPGATTKQISFFNNGTPRGLVRTSDALRLDSAGTTTEKNNVVSCTPGKYTFLNGGSTPQASNIQSYVYTLLVNGKAVSTISSDGFKSVASHLFPTIAGNMAGTATLEGASWDLKGMSNYSAQCQVYATQSGGNIQSMTTTAHDAVALAAAAAEAAKVQMTKDMIANWNASNEAAAKKLRDNRLAGKP
jgi:hypothetical protein